MLGTRLPSGPAGLPIGGPSSFVFDAVVFPCGLGPGGIGLGKGGLYSQPPGTSTVPSSICNKVDLPDSVGSWL